MKNIYKAIFASITSIRFVYFVVPFLLLTCPITTYADLSDLSPKQLEVRAGLLKLSDEELVWVRALNNSFAKNCGSHRKAELMKQFSQVVAQIVVSDRPSVVNPANHLKYGYRKGQLNYLIKKNGVAQHCDCVYKYFFIGDTACLQ